MVEKKHDYSNSVNPKTPHYLNSYNPKNKFEFSLTINGFPVCARFFSADDYNPKVRNSVDIRNQIDDIVTKLQSVLVKRDVDYQYLQYDLRQNAFMNKWSNEIKSAKKFVENNKKLY